MRIDRPGDARGRDHAGTAGVAFCCVGLAGLVFLVIGAIDVCDPALVGTRTGMEIVFRTADLFGGLTAIGAAISVLRARTIRAQNLSEWGLVAAALLLAIGASELAYIDLARPDLARELASVWYEGKAILGGIAFVGALPLAVLKAKRW